jgi:solute carrier family 45, member 1/2/4
VGAIRIGTHISNAPRSLTDHTIQLAEAILTEPGPASADDGGSIMLEDARTRQTELDAERVGFLSAHDHDRDEDSDKDDEDDEDLRKAQENRKKLLGNHAAHVSSFSVDRSLERPRQSSDNEYEVVDPSDISSPYVGSRRSASHSSSSEPEPHAPSGGLSAKAGIILVRHSKFSPAAHAYRFHGRAFTTSSLLSPSSS